MGCVVDLLSWLQHNERSSAEGPYGEDCIYSFSPEDRNSIHSTHSTVFIFKTKRVYEDVTVLE